jgi:hypothetical protein
MNNKKPFQFILIDVFSGRLINFINQEFQRNKIICFILRN